MVEVVRRHAGRGHAMAIFQRRNKASSEIVEMNPDLGALRSL
jgi:hypothetical protein